MPERRLNGTWRRAALLLPLVGCALIYSRIGQVIAWAGLPEVHTALLACDRMVFAVHPAVWWRDHGTPVAADILSCCYLGYNLVVGAVAIAAVWWRPQKEGWAVVRGLTVTYLVGYILYVLLPAAPPHAVLGDDLAGGATGGWLTSLQARSTALNPNALRGAFPSLHCAVTLVAMLEAWRFSRRFFLVLVLPALGLVPAVLLLGHHYLLDVVAGMVLGAGVWVFNRRPPAAGRGAAVCHPSSFTGLHSHFFLLATRPHLVQTNWGLPTISRSSPSRLA